MSLILISHCSQVVFSFRMHAVIALTEQAAYCLNTHVVISYDRGGEGCWSWESLVSASATHGF